MNPSGDFIEASVLEELERFVREARGPRALAAIGPDASLERDLGLGSLERVELLSRLETRFRRRAPERTLGEAETPRDLARAFLTAAEGLPRDEREVLPEARFRSRSNPAADARTLADVLSLWAHAEPELPHVYLKEDDLPEETVAYSVCAKRRSSSGALSIRGGVRRGDTVAIMLRTSRGFLSTFMGALFAGRYPSLSILRSAVRGSGSTPAASRGSSRTRRRGFWSPSPKDALSARCCARPFRRSGK
jgi:acyl carrier protein